MDLGVKDLGRRQKWAGVIGKEAITILDKRKYGGRGEEDYYLISANDRKRKKSRMGFGWGDK